MSSHFLSPRRARHRDQAFLRAGVGLLSAAGVAFFGFFLTHAADHNVYMAFALGLSAAAAAGAHLYARVGWFQRYAPSKVIVFTTILVVSGLFVATMDVPINVVSVRLGPIAASMEFLLQPHGATGRRELLSAFATRAEPSATATFTLADPIGDRDPPLTLHFRSPNAFDVHCVSYGSDLPFGWVPMARFCMKDVLRVATSGSDADSLLVIDDHVRLVNTLRSLPRLHIAADEGLVRSSTDPIRVRVIKALWLLLYAAIATLAIWGRGLAGACAPSRVAMRDYLLS